MARSVTMAKLVFALGALACDPQIVDAVDVNPCARGNSVECPPVIWPNEISKTNSDRWLVDHHDQIVEMRPRVLILDFFNSPSGTSDETLAAARSQAAAIAIGSKYRAYARSDDPPAFLKYGVDVVPLVDLTDHPRPATVSPASSWYPVSGGKFDHAQLFSQAWANQHFNSFPDSADSTRNLTLCELFERGIINEVWLATGDFLSGPTGPFMMAERKQVYDSSNRAIATMFEPSAGGEILDGITCKVTIRIAHLDPTHGLGCDLEIRGFNFEYLWKAVPSVETDMRAFVNSDFRARFGVPFDRWADICGSGQACLTYPTASSAAGVNMSWRINNFVQGCGTPHFPPNATRKWDWKNDKPVNSRCEHFGLRDGPDRSQDQVEPYTFGKTKAYADLLDSMKPPAASSSAPDDCGGGWQLWFRQSIPGLLNGAYSSVSGDDGRPRPMRNWWPFLFY